MAHKKSEPNAEPAESDEIVSIKGFDTNLSCRGHKFEIGKTYEPEGDVEACSSGWHAVEGHPLEVFDYYAPASSRYALVRQSGKLTRHSDDSKVASAKITIDAELQVPDLIKRAVDYVFSKAEPGKGSTATGDYGAAMSSGRDGRAMAAEGCAIFLVHRDDNWKIIHAWAGVAGRDGIKPLTFYTLDASGQPVEGVAP